MSDERDSTAGDIPWTDGYDALDGTEQARVRASWDERMATLRSELDLERDFSSAGRAYVELDDHGRVVRRAPDAPGVIR